MRAWFGRAVGGWFFVAAGCAETVGGVADAASGDASSPADAPLDPASFLQRERAAACAQVLRCPGAVTLGAMAFASAVDCVAHLRRYAAQRDRQRLEAVGAGRMRFAEAAARRCLEAVGQQCRSSYGPVEACLGVLTGAIAAGGMCELPEECADGLFCDHGDPNDPACPGRCAARNVPPGAAPLTSPYACRADPGAAAWFVSPRCYSLRAAPPAGPGEPCDWVDVVDGRVRVASCEAGLACTNHRLGTAGRCMRPLLGGAPCAPGDVCAVGFVCQRAAPEGWRCEPRGVAHEPGGPCTPGLPPGGAPPTCDPLRHLTCGDDGRCARVGDGSDGARCVPGVNVEGLCGEGLYCDRDGEAPTCRRLRDAGAACRSDSACLSVSCRGGACAARLCD